jgi:hypothetical protein
MKARREKVDNLVALPETTGRQRCARVSACVVVAGASFAACLPWPATDDDSGGSDSTGDKEDREAEKLAHGDLIYRLEGYQSVNLSTGLTPQ